MSIIWHFISSLILGISLYGESYNLVIAFIIGGTLIDIDHLLISSYKTKSLNMRKNIEWLKENFKTHTPHYYIFHSGIAIIFFLVLALSPWPIVRAIALGALLHLLVDVATYLYVYRSIKPWGKFFCLITGLLKK